MIQDFQLALSLNGPIHKNTVTRLDPKGQRKESKEVADSLGFLDGKPCVRD